MICELFAACCPLAKIDAWPKLCNLELTWVAEYEELLVVRAPPVVPANVVAAVLPVPVDVARLPSRTDLFVAECDEVAAAWFEAC